MAITGLRNTENFGSNERPKNWREGILLQYPNGDFPLFALTSQMQQRKVDDPEYNWFEKPLDSRRLKLASDIANNTTSLTLVAKAKTVVKNTLLKNLSTGEIFCVTADPSSDTALTVSRGYASTTATAIDVSDEDPYLIVIGNVFEEGSAAPTGQGYDPTTVTNYTQIFRRTLEITRTAAGTRLRTGEAVKEAKRECLEMISVDIERAFWLGKKSLSYVNSQPCRTFDGIYHQIASRAANNIVDASQANSGAGVDYDWLEAQMKEAFKFGSKEKMGFCGDTFLLTVQKIVRGVNNTVWQFKGGEKEYGMNVNRLVTPFGTLVLKSCPLFNNIESEAVGSGHAYGLDSYCFILDMAKVKYVIFDKDDLRYEQDLQSNGLDGKKSGYIAEISIELAQAENHFIIKNMSKVKAPVAEVKLTSDSTVGLASGTTVKVSEIEATVKTKEQS